MSVTTPTENHVAGIHLCLNVDVWTESFGDFGDDGCDQQARNMRRGLMATSQLRGRTAQNKNEAYFALPIIATVALTDAVTVPRSGSSRRTLSPGGTEKRSSLLNARHGQLRRIQQSHLHQQ